MIPRWRGARNRSWRMTKLNSSSRYQTCHHQVLILAKINIAFVIMIIIMRNDNSAKKVRDEGKTGIQTLSDIGCHCLSSMMMGPHESSQSLIVPYSKIKDNRLSYLLYMHQQYMDCERFHHDSWILSSSIPNLSSEEKYWMRGLCPC